jgi:hypothetical protein
MSYLAFLPGGRYLATSVTNGTARIWDTSTGAAVTLLALPDGGYAALLPDGAYKLKGDAGDYLWWADGRRRFGPGELDAGGAIRRLPDEAEVLPPARRGLER